MTKFSQTKQLEKNNVLEFKNNQSKLTLLIQQFLTGTIDVPIINISGEKIASL